MSAGFSISGLVSGIDSNSVVSQLMAVERIPVRSMSAQQAKVQKSIDTFASITQRVTALQTAVKKIDEVKDFNAFVTATSSSDAVTAVANGAASVGSLSFKVSQLASQHQMFGADQFTAGSDLVGAGTVTINVDGTDHAITTNDASSLNDLANAINEAGIGVNASVVTKSTGDVRLMLTSADTGADAAFTVNSTAAGVTAFTEVSTAQNSIITFGNPPNEVTVERPTNTVGDLISGVTLTLTATTTDKVTVTTSRDDDAMVEAVQGFVTELNATIAEMAASIAYNPDTGGGPLSGNSTVRDMLDSLRRSVSQPVENLGGTYSYASSVGLQIQSNGSFVLNETTLRTAMTDDFAAVANLFAASASATDSRVAFSDAASGTKAGVYNVSITQAASVAKATGPDFAAPGSAPATFSITGPGGKVVSVATSPYGSASDVVDQINAALTAQGITSLLASVDNSSGNDRISLATTSYGSDVSFTVDVDGDAYGINGTWNGTDVAGTINGAAATGTGRILRSTAGESNGLRLSVSASQSEVDGAGGTLSVGTVEYSTGIAGKLSALLKEFTATEGTIAMATDSLQDRVDLYKDRIEAFERRLVVRESYLRRQFTAMETAVSQLQSQANFFASQIGALTGGQ